MSTLSSLAVDAVQPVQIEVNLGQVEVSTSYVMRAGTEQVQFEAGAIRLTNAVSEHPDPLTLHVAGANEQVRIDPVSPLPARTHYLIGDDPGRFIIDVPAYKELVYRGIYPGIDLVVRGADSRIELEYLLAAGADRTVLLLDLQGVQRLDFEATGGVLLATATRTIHLLRPTVEVSPAAAPLDATFVRVGTSLGIAIAGASSEVPVRLRTAIELSGPSASSLSESILGAPQVARDASGHLWVVGRVASAQESQRTDRANYFVAKLDPSGREVLQTTFLGSSANEIPHALAITTLGEIVVAGQSTPLDSGNPDIFVTRLAPDARSVISQAVFGGSGTDVAHALITDANGSAWIAGNTTSSDFPVSDSGAQRSPGGEGDAFVAKLDRSGGIRFASYLGGTASDDAAGLAVDSRGAIYVSGTTRSTNFPQAIYISPAQTGSADAFVVKLDPVHGSLAFSTVLGGSDDDRAIAIVAGDAPEVVIAGTTRSNDFPIIDGQQPMSGGGADAFVCRIDAISGALRSATYLGGAGDEYIEALARDRSGRVMIVGSSNSNDFGAARLSRRSLGGGRDAFVARVELRSAERLRVMLLGGEGDDDASEVALDANGGAVLVGLTKSTNFATASRLMSSPDGDVFTASVGAENDGPLGSCPGTKQWVGGTSNAWENSLNWSGGTLPGGGDDVCIQGAAVVLGTGAQSAASLRVDGGGSLTINAGTLTIAGASEINGNLTINGGTLAGTGNVTVSGTLTWTGGTMTGAGTTTANGPLNISGAAVKDLTSNRIFNNNLIATWTGTGGIRIGTGAVLNNNGTWDAQNDSAISIQFTGPAAVNNVGTFKKSAGAGSTSISINFNNSGTVLVQSGTLSVSGGGSSSAAFNVALATATMQFAGSAYDLNAGTTFVGPGTALSTGTLNVNTAIGIPATMTFTMTGGIVQGTGTLTTAGTLNWSGGTMSGAGTTTANGPLNISGAAVKDLTSNRIFNNNLIATWTGTGGIRIGTGAVLNNNGTWDAQNDSAISIQFTGPAAVNNVGTFKKSAGTGSTSISINFNNTGTVLVQSGTLSVSGGGNSSAAFNVASAAATMQFAGSAYDLNAGTTFVGPGTALSTGTLNVNTAIGIPATMTFTMTGGIVQGTGTLTTAGTLNWSGGTMTGAGTTTANGPFNISGAAVKDLTSSRILNNNLIATWTGTGGIRIGTGAVLNNDGTWDAQNDSAISIQFTGPAAVNNVGTFKKSAGTGSTAISINFNNSGTVDIQTGTLSLSSSNFSQTAGVTQLTGGALVSTTNLNFLGGRLAGSGTITAPVIVSGTAALTPGLSPGTLNLVGDYTQQAPSGAFNVEIAGTNPGTGYDRLNISGVGSNAELAGVLNVSLSSGFTPNSTDSFTVMTYPTRTGNYVLNLPAAGCLGWVVDYGATALTLSLVDVPVQLQGLMIAANKSDLTWAAPPINPATLYDVVRGGLAQLPVGSTANETCIARGIGERTASDPGRPGAGQGFWYLVRERVPGCANGTYGFASNGTERSTSTCP